MTTNPTYTTTVVLVTPFSVTFSGCVTGELPQGDSADGCFAGQNGTADTWTGISLTVPDTGGVVGTTFSCSTSSNGNIYSTAVCPPNPNGLGVFTTAFTSGTIIPGETFFITETGVDPSTFPTSTASVTDSVGGTVPVTGVTPEPESLILFATGLLGVGGSVRWSRRRA